MSIEAGVETVPSATDNRPMLTHLICVTCVPEPKMGDTAICGERILGTPPTKKADCADCHRLRVDHVLKVHQTFWGR